MNLCLFNRVNLKESSDNKGMYSEWTSLNPVMQTCGEEAQSVLDKFGITVGREVTLGIVHQLASNLGITHLAQPSPLTTDREVQWCMEVICFGLSLPLSEHDAIKDCVNVYCEWLTALLPAPKLCVPKPVCEEPNLYARKIITHFYYLFVPRKGEGPDIINRQAVLCHRVLRSLQQMARESQLLQADTWEALLLFLLAINDTLLSPPTIKDDVADQLCERVLSVLFEVWLIACARCFPSPSLWKTLRECCLNWRHRITLIEQWNRVNLVLTAQLLTFMYGPAFPKLKLGDEDIMLQGMTNDCVAQSWYRFLNTIGNPVSLTKPEVISQTQKFLQFAISSDTVLDPCQHPCLHTLPLIFLKAIKGISAQVDAFLGIEQQVTGAKGKEGPAQSPPSQRRLAKSFSIAPNTTKGTPKNSIMNLTGSRSTRSSSNSSTSTLASSSSVTFEHKTPAPERSKCNSILHLFGEWLFDAAFIGADITESHSIEQNKRPNSIIMDGTKGSINLNASQPSSMNSMPPLPLNLTIDKYESGRAEALGALCYIFCAKKTGEEILPSYLARFYLAVQRGLKIPENQECGESVVSILIHSSDLFRLDLDGVRVLIPAFISALEVVLPDKDLKLQANTSKIELRRASIHLLMSVLVLPLHFQDLPLRELIAGGSQERPVTFAQLKPRLMNLVMNALQVETDPSNTHMLLGALFLCVQDSAAFETEELVTQPSTETASNLLSSVSDTVSTASMSTSSSLLDQPPFQQPDAQTVDSAHALFVRATYLVCHRLISSWKTDLNVSLAALELLSGLARIHIRETDALECKRAVKWLCDYIVYQCSRPPPSHSKDLHSTIVAAFHCCSVWLLQHPYLLKDKDCLTTVLEVAELGVSGTKSMGKPGEKIKMKDDKELKPASMRVRDAAENLLTCILEQVGYFPSECGPESVSSMLDEVSLLQHCNSWPSSCSDKEVAVERFRYFVSDSSVILALLEEPLGNDQDPQPTVTIVIRGPFGRHAWTMQLRHLPRHRSRTKYHATNPGRPVAMQDAPSRPEIRQKYFPESVDRVMQCRIDQSIPHLESILEHDSVSRQDTEKLAQLLGRQVAAEVKLSAVHSLSECAPPAVCHDFQTARLFLSHFGFLSLQSDTEDCSSQRLAALDSGVADFCKELTALDDMSPRTCDTVHIFYVRSQQTTASEITSNVLHKSNVSAYFLEFLHTLGWPVQVHTHPGWTGHVSTSWKVLPKSQTSVHCSDHGGALYDGGTQVLYWADACSEIAFVVPSQTGDIEQEAKKPTFNTSSLSSWYERSLSEENIAREKRTHSLDLDKQPAPVRRSNNRYNLNPLANTKILVAWLESYEDHMTLPINDLLSCTNTGLEVSATKLGDVLLIYLHCLESGLLRVHLRGPGGRVGLALPLVDGMIVSRRTLGPLVRQTALNMLRRRRLDCDTYQPPHVRRRLKVQEISQKYKREMTEPELLTYLFSNP